MGWRVHISWILSWATLTISFFRLSFPRVSKSKSQECSSGRRWKLQKTYPHLHSIPRRPSFFLQLKHRFLFSCGAFVILWLCVSYLAIELFSAGSFSFFSILFSWCALLNNNQNTSSTWSTALRTKHWPKISGTTCTFQTLSLLW